MSQNLTKTTGKFIKGQSGNPGGRPKGAKNKTTLLREAMQDKTDRMLSRAAGDVLQVVIRAAKKGDMAAAKMLLDRIIPVQKASDGTGSQPVKGITIEIRNLTAAPTEKVIEGTAVTIEDM